MAVSSTLQAPWYLLANVQNSPSGTNPFLSPFYTPKDPEIDSPIGRLPQELLLTIFSYLDADALVACSLTCKHWKRIADTEALWKALYPKIAFGQEQWKTYFGDVGEVPPLPRRVYAYLNSPCPFWEGKKVHETHLLVLVPQTVNGKPLNLKTLEELVQKPLQGHATKYSYFNVGEYIDAPASASHWTLMSRDVIPNSRKKTYADQQKLVQRYAGYEIPKVLDMAVAILGEYVRIGTRLYNDSPWTFTRCQEKWNKDWQLAVGGFAPGGLVVDYYGYGDGMGVSRKF